MSRFQALESVVTNLASFWSSSELRGVAIWILAFVFVLTGFAKLRRPALAAMAIVDFGVLRRVRPRVGTILGGFELLLGLVIALRVEPVTALSLAVCLLWTFTFLIARALLSGADFACFCFGRAGSVLSKGTLARTVSLALLASVGAILEKQDVLATGQAGEPLIELLAAAVFVGITVLMVQIPGLLRWNKWIANYDGTGTP